MNHGARITILLVEDDEELLGLLGSLLQEEGYRVLAAESGERALEIAQSTSYDLVVTDVKLGGIDGLDTLSELKQSRSELQSLVITGYATEADSIRAISLGVGNYLKKPFNLPDFLRAVQEIATQIYKERDLAEFKTAAYETALWSLENLAASSGKDRFRETAKLAEKAALSKGLSTSASRAIRLSLLALLGEESDLEIEIPFVLRVLPEPSRRLLAEIGTDAEATSDDLKILRYALRKLRGETGDGDEEDDALEQSFSLVPTQTLESEQTSSSLDVGKYLALAKALEVSGDIDAASQVLEGFGQENRRLAPQALLYRAKVHWIKGESSKAEQVLVQALETCGELSQRAKIQLEGGVLFAEMRSQEQARQWLESAVENFDNLHNPSERSRAILALQATSGGNDFSPEELEILLQPHQLEALLTSAPWLFPFLLRVPESAVVDKARVRLTRDAPQAVSRCLLGTELDLDQRLKGLDVIDQVGIDGYDELLQEFMLISEPKLRQKAQTLLENQDSVKVSPILRLYALGSMATWLGERRVPDKGWTGSKPFFLLNYLAQQGGEFVSQEKLLELFWGGATRANKNLNQTLVVIRNNLRSPVWPDKIDYVERRGTMIGLSTAHRIWHDGSLVMDSLIRGEGFLREENRKRASDCFHQALELDRGPYLETCYEDWAISFRETLNLKLMSCLTAFADIRLSQNRAADGVMILEHVLGKDPYYSAAIKSLYEAYLALGQPLEVIKAFERLEGRMKRELDLEPDLDIVKLYHTARLKL